jgi:hypothetical protein
MNRGLKARRFEPCRASQVNQLAAYLLIFDSHGDVELAQTRKRQRGRLATPSVGDGVGVTGAA